MTETEPKNYKDRYMEIIDKILTENKNCKLGKISLFVGELIGTIEGLKMQLEQLGVTPCSPEKNNTQLPKSDAICNTQVSNSGKGALPSAETYNSQNKNYSHQQTKPNIIGSEDNSLSEVISDKTAGGVENSPKENLQ